MLSCFGKKSKSSSKSKNNKNRPGKKGADGFSLIPDGDLHIKCRCNDANKPFVYETVDGNDITRAYVPDTNVAWNVDWPEYAPVEYTQPSILKDKPVWADPESPKGIKFNEIDGKIDRRSFEGKYGFDSDGRPINPRGRTGMRQRGKLGKWGPNHAADPIVTRWKRDDKGKKVKHQKTKKPILQFVAIERKDTGEWAIPGGMCDPGEPISLTLKREFMEEAKNSLQMTDAQKKAEAEKMDKIFKNGKEIYKGYVDDPRNTDNSWMETQAFNFHDEDGKTFDHKLSAGDDAAKVKWMDIGSEIKLYASHKDFIEKVVKAHKAHW